MHELTGPISLISADRFWVGGAVTGIEPAQTFGPKNVLHRRRSQPRLKRDVIGPPTALSAKPDHLRTSPRGRFVRRVVRPRRPIPQPEGPLGNEPVTSLAHRLRIDLEPLRGRLDRPALLENAPHHSVPAVRGQHRVRALGSSVSHEPSG
jgi:hypothetical protein